MDPAKVKPIYDMVNELISNAKIAEELPGFDELCDFILGHSRVMVKDLMLSFSPRTLSGALENTLYLGIIIGLIYNQLHGMPEWAINLLRRVKDG